MRRGKGRVSAQRDAVPLNAQKKALREVYLQRRRAITSAQKQTLDAQIVSRVLRSGAYRTAQTVLCYLPMAHEVDVTPILLDAWRSGKRVAAPRCRPHGQMDFFTIRDMQDLSRGAWGISEPNADRPLCVPDEASLCIVPALAADAEGYRLGHGGGYYDRYFAAHPVRKLGVCYAFCVSPALPREPFDIPIDLWITDVYPKEV